jgi:hypothetical protein
MRRFACHGPPSNGGPDDTPCFDTPWRTRVSFENLWIDLVLHRPAGAARLRWTEVMTRACRERLVPDLQSFSISDDRACLSLAVASAPASALADNLGVLASLCSASVQPQRPVPAPRPRCREMGIHEMMAIARNRNALRGR